MFLLTSTVFTIKVVLQSCMNNKSNLLPSTKADRGIFLEVDDFSQNFVTMCSVVNLHITNFC